MHDETWAAAVRYAVDQGTDVINMSFGNDGGKTLSEGRVAIAYAQAHDVVVVAAALGVPWPPTVRRAARRRRRRRHRQGRQPLEVSNAGGGPPLMAPGVEILGADPTRS
ncbi:S8 family serine peptidase [Streptomyces chartreusis]|uniref:S8 family serine peptidase n=1 Tax=Streptomyces chartreusis TaxID=1969 RepID=UPI0036BCD134